MKGSYRITLGKTSQCRRRLACFPMKEGQLWLLPMLELSDTGQRVVELCGPPITR